MKPVLIVGGGLAGVSTAYHLKNRPIVLAEKENEVGGTARSYHVGKFTFDITGHLLHLHSDYTKKLIPKLLANNFFTCQRNAKVFSNGRVTKFPFQAYTNGLPSSVVDECVLGFFDAFLTSAHKKPSSDPDFRTWCFETFGSGIAKHFMIPYNEKLYQVRATAMTTDWCGPFVPMPKLKDVVRGALENEGDNFGYNTSFIYPKNGGIQVLAQALAKRVEGIQLNTTVDRINLRERTATLSNGKTVSYSSLVNTIPLPELLKKISPLPRSIKQASNQLRFSSIWCVNIGVRRPRISDASWIYFAEKHFPFYRVGFPMNFTPHVVPKGCSSMYVEVPMRSNRNKSKPELLADIRKGLVRAGILKPSDKFVIVQFIPVKYAYVIYNRDRRAALKKIFSFLNRNSIQTIGRYGAWKYSFMEEAILDGKKAAEKILNG